MEEEEKNRHRSGGRGEKKEGDPDRAQQFPRLRKFESRALKERTERRRKMPRGREGPKELDTTGCVGILVNRGKGKEDQKHIVRTKGKKGRKT